MFLEEQYVEVKSKNKTDCPCWLHGQYRKSQGIQVRWFDCTHKTSDKNLQQTEKEQTEQTNEVQEETVTDTESEGEQNEK